MEFYGQATNAKEETIIGQEKEQVEIAYVSAAINKLGDDVTATDLQKELDKVAITEVTNNGDGTLNVLFNDTQHNYNVNNGKVTKVEPKELPIVTEPPMVAVEEDTKFQDATSDNKIAVIPKGFRVSSETSEQSINTGLVVIGPDDSEFVWIAVDGIFDGTNLDTNIVQLGRYEFDSEGIHFAYSGEYTEDTIENHNSEYTNSIAKNINAFIKSVSQNGGYYIARYEASINDDGQIQSKYAEAVTGITQNEASELCQNMYTKEQTTAKTDLINSYAWDTAIVFLQKYDDREDRSSPYSCKYWNNYASFSSDKICNIYNMLGNRMEFTTETSNDSTKPCSVRGSYTGTRRILSESLE